MIVEDVEEEALAWATPLHSEYWRWSWSSVISSRSRWWTTIRTRNTSSSTRSSTRRQLRRRRSCSSILVGNITRFALDTKSVTHAKPLVRLHSNVWSIKHLYEAPKSIYLSSENNLPLIRLNGYLGRVHLPRINSTNRLVLLISPLSCHFAAGTDKKGIPSIRTILVLI